jgi:hypothetical protein
LKPYPAKCSISSKSLAAFFSLIPFAARPSMKAPRCCAITFGILLAHGLAQHVGLPEREAGDRLRDPHHLLLVGDDAVGVGENRLELRQLVLDSAFPACGR